MDTAFLAVIVSAVVGLAGFVTGFLTVLLSYRERKSAHREFLYEKQIEAYKATMDALGDLYNACLGYIATHGMVLNSQTRPQMRVETMAEHRAFILEFTKWSLFFPTYFNEEVSGFL